MWGCCGIESSHFRTAIGEENSSPTGISFYLRYTGKTERHFGKTAAVPRDDEAIKSDLIDHGTAYSRHIRRGFGLGREETVAGLGIDHNQLNTARSDVKSCCSHFAEALFYKLEERLHAGLQLGRVLHAVIRLNPQEGNAFLAHCLPH